FGLHGSQRRDSKMYTKLAGHIKINKNIEMQTEESHKSGRTQNKSKWSKIFGKNPFSKNVIDLGTKEGRRELASKLIKEYNVVCQKNQHQTFEKFADEFLDISNLSSKMRDKLAGGTEENLTKVKVFCKNHIKKMIKRDRNNLITIYGTKVERNILLAVAKAVRLSTITDSERKDIKDA